MRSAKTPQDLRNHRLLAFSLWRPENSWTFTNANGGGKETLKFQAYLSINQYAGLAPVVLEEAGIGELPPIVQPELLREGRLVEVMPDWHFPVNNLVAVHLGNRYARRAVRLFKE